MTRLNNEDRFIEMMIEMGDAYVSSFRGSTFFSDYDANEVRDLIDFIDRRLKTAKGEITSALWQTISNLAVSLLESYEDLEEVESNI